MSDILTMYGAGRLTKDPEVMSYGTGKSFTKLSIACSLGFGEYAQTYFVNATAFGKTGENINKYFKKGDQIIFQGTPQQNKKDDKVYHGVVISSFAFGQKKGEGKQSASEKSSTPQEQESPFDDNDIPF